MRFLLNLDCHKKMKRYLITICLAVGMVLPAAARSRVVQVCVGGVSSLLAEAVIERSDRRHEHFPPSREHGFGASECEAIRTRKSVREP